MKRPEDRAIDKLSDEFRKVLWDAVEEAYNSGATEALNALISSLKVLVNNPNDQASQFIRHIEQFAAKRGIKLAGDA